MLKKFEQENNKFYYTGNCWFSELTPENNYQKKRWEKKRNRAYKGSFAHFLAALANDRLRREGFDIRGSLFPPTKGEIVSFFEATRNDIFRKKKKAGEFTLYFPYYLRIIYNNEQEEYNYLRLQKSNNPQIKLRLKPEAQTSWLWLHAKPVTFNNQCQVLKNAYTITTAGLLGLGRYRRNAAPRL